MSYSNTRKALLTKLSSATIPNITNSDIGYDNDNFDPKGKSNWLSAYFIPADSQPNGKSIVDNNSDTGFLQVSVYSKLDGYDVAQFEIIDSILSEFRNSSIATYQDQDVCILNSTVNQGFSDGDWWKRDITINYLTQSKKV